MSALDINIVMQSTQDGIMPTAAFNEAFNAAGRPAADFAAQLGKAIYDKWPTDAAARQKASWTTMDAFLAAIQPALDAAEKNAFGSAYLMATQGIGKTQ